MWERLALQQLAGLGWTELRGEDTAPGSGRRAGWDDLVLHDELRAAIERLNPSELSTWPVQTVQIRTKSRGHSS
ncbi:hypothetical protein [Streptomyces sp. NPDC002671]